MPAKGYKSITISTEAYDHFWAKYQEQKKHLRTLGIYDFNGFMTSKLWPATQEQTHLFNLAKKIQKLPPGTTIPTIKLKLHCRSAPIIPGEPIPKSWITPWGLVKKPRNVRYGPTKPIIGSLE